MASNDSVRIKILILIGGQVPNKPNSMEERAQSKNDLETKGVCLKLYWDHVSRNHLFTLDDVLKKRGLDSLRPSPLVFGANYAPRPWNHRG
jgi:hypothetical protein